MEFQTFINLSWPWFVGCVIIKVGCWLIGGFKFFSSKSLGE